MVRSLKTLLYSASICFCFLVSGVAEMVPDDDDCMKEVDSVDEEGEEMGV